MKEIRSLKNFKVTRTRISKYKDIAKTEVIAETEEEARKKIEEGRNYGSPLGINESTQTLLESEETLEIEPAN